MLHRVKVLARPVVCSSVRSFVRPFASVLVSALAVCAGASSAFAGSAVPQVTRAVDTSAYVRLRGNTAPLGPKALDRGVVPAATPASRMMLLLKRPAEQEAALKSFLADVHTPGSPSYHKWLTPAQFGDRFGPADSDVQAVVGWLQTQGFSVAKVSPGKTLIEFSGTTGQVAKAFHTSIHSFSIGGVGHVANVSDPAVPAALLPVIGGLSPLNDLRPKPFLKVKGQAEYTPATHRAKPLWTYQDTNGTTFPLAPEDFSVEYDTQPLLSAGVNGQGQTIAIINDSNVDPALVASFRTLFGLPAQTLNVTVDGNDPGVNGDAIEAYLDVEWAGAVAPNANVVLYTAANTYFQSGVILAAQRAIDENKAPVVSVSFGLCEQALGVDGNFLLSSIWQQAAAQGQTVLVAAGDSGAAGCDSTTQPDGSTTTLAQGGLAVSGFASTPYNVAVGGTDFFYKSWNSGNSAINSELQSFWSGTNDSNNGSLMSRISEQPWNDSQFGENLGGYNSANASIAGGGGGLSSCATQNLDNAGNFVSCAAGYPLPDWQVGSGVPNKGVRVLPDVSLFAADGANASYYPLCAQSGDCTTLNSSGFTVISGVGGTSAATPSMAGIMAMVNQKFGRQGQADYVLYPLASQHASDFHDVTTGSNNEPCQSGSPNCAQDSGDSYTSLQNYSATTGYDAASGLGTLDANALITDWNSVTFQSSATTLALSSASFVHGTKVTLTSNVTSTSGAPVGDGSVGFLTSLGNPINTGLFAVSVANGTATAATTGLPGGTYQLTARYSGGTTYGPSQSAPQTLTVTPESSAVQFQVTAADANGNPIPVPAAPQPYGTFLAADIAVVSGTAPSSQVNGIATGVVAIMQDGVAAGSVNLNSASQAEYIPPGLGYFAVGTHTLSASYAGDGSFKASAGTPVTFSIAKAPTALSVASSTTSGTTVNTTVVVTPTPASGAAAPTGTITASANGQTIGNAVPVTSTQDATTGASLGTATLSLPSSSAGVGFTYSGDVNYSGATVGAAPYAVAAAQPSLTIASAGQSTNTAVSVTPTGGFTGTVNLTCTVAGPAGAQEIPTCALSPAAVTVTGAGAVNSTLTITTTAASSAVRKASNEGGRFWYATGGTTLAGLFLLGLPGRRRRWNSLLGLLLIIGAFGAVGCGGGGSSAPSNPGTTTGAYTVTVAGTSGSQTSQTVVNVTLQ